MKSLAGASLSLIVSNCIEFVMSKLGKLGYLR